MDAALTINLLGRPTVIRNGAPVRGFVSVKAEALVYYLVASGRTHAREFLATLLWAESSEEQALKNLRDVLSNVRRLLPDYLLITRQTASFNTGAEYLLDSQRFRELLAHAQRTSGAVAATALRQAVALYRGDFLEGMYAAQAPEFEDWVTVEREHLRQQMQYALHQLADHCAATGEYGDGIGYASRLLGMDPWLEEAHRELMLLLALSGQRSAALAQYATCRRALRDELGVDPADETTDLYERILAGDVTSTVPALAASRPLHNLAAPLTPLIGRETEVAQITALLCSSSCRLVTVVGPGGAGKTRIAQHIGHKLLAAQHKGDAFVHGIFFVPLFAVDEELWESDDVEQGMEDALSARVADSLQLSLAGSSTPHKQLLQFLRDKEVLLILDNCEHLPSLAKWVVNLLTQAPRLTLLATSRARLNVGGEHSIELGGLPFPSNESDAMERWERYGALALFHQSAHAVQPQFSFSAAERAAATRICALLDGLPLGIELAANLLRLLPCEEIAAEIAASVEVLQSARRDIPERHRSLRAVFDHSWDLLTVPERQALRRLSVFRSSFEREAAQQAASVSLPLLASLVDKSLLRVATLEQQGQGRYTLLEAVRQYAAERLAEAPGNEQDAIRDRHSRYYLALVAQRASDLRGTQQQEAVETLTEGIENIREAWRWAVRRSHLDILGQAASGLFYFYEMRSWFGEGADLFALAVQAAAHRADDDAQLQVVRGRLLARQGWLTFHRGRPVAARELLEQSLTLLRPLDAPTDLIFTLTRLGSALYYAGDYKQAEQFAAEALSVSLDCGDRDGEVVARTVLGQIAYLVGRYEDARRYAYASLVLERELGNRWGTAFTLINLGRTVSALGDYQQARRHFEEALSIRESMRDTRGIALCLNHLGDTAAALSEYTEAAHQYEASLALYREIGHLEGIAASWLRLGRNALATGDRASAHAALHEALQIAYRARSVPQQLDALAGLAAAHVADTPVEAGRLVALVAQHPSSTKESRNRAMLLWHQLEPNAHQREVAADETVQHEALDEIVLIMMAKR